MTNRRRTDYIVVHVTATPPSWSKGMAGVTAMHRRRGWSRPGYAAVIRRPDRNGVVKVEFAPGGLHVIRNHVRGFNSVAIGVSMEGGVDKNGRAENNMPESMFVELEKLLRDWTKKFPKAGVCGHRDLSPDRDGDGVIEPHEYLKQCPCFDAIPWAKSRGIRTANIKGTWGRGIPRRTAPPPAPDARNVYLQNLLQRAGYEFGPVDGLIGPKTKAAIKRFQRASGLRASGEFDRDTVATLRDMFERSRPAPVKVPTPVVTNEMHTLMDDVAAEGRFSKTEMATGGIAGLGVASTAANQAGDALDSVKRVTETIGIPTWFWPILVMVLIIAGGGYIWYSRRKKRHLAMKAKRVLAHVETVDFSEDFDTW